MMLADEFQGFIFDLDGVIWKGATLIPGADETVKKIRELGKTVLFLTNNASKSRSQYSKKLASMRIKADVDEIITSGSVTAQYLTEKHGKARVYVVGMDGLREELSLAGHVLVDVDPEFVVVGMDESFTYDKLLKAFRFVHYGGALLVATNNDVIADRDDGLVPIAGSILASIERATGVYAEVCGKPYGPMIDFISQRVGSPKDEVLMVGDNLDTDIAFGRAAGFKTAFVLTGVHSKKDAQKMNSNPDYIINNITGLVRKR
ncbi:MAG: HAD-IIA family hydrolase [Candidatus Altiarchaeota archaeon]